MVAGVNFVLVEPKGLVISSAVIIFNPHGRERYQGVPAQSYQNCRAYAISHVPVFQINSYTRILIAHCVLGTVFF